jgi:hypothetical protein
MLRTSDSANALGHKNNPSGELLLTRLPTDGIFLLTVCLYEIEAVGLVGV